MPDGMWIILTVSPEHAELNGEVVVWKDALGGQRLPPGNFAISPAGVLRQLPPAERL